MSAAVLGHYRRQCLGRAVKIPVLRMQRLRESDEPHGGKGGSTRSCADAHLLRVLHGFHLLLDGGYKVLRRRVTDTHVVLPVERNEPGLCCNCLLLRCLGPLWERARGAGGGEVETAMGGRAELQRRPGRHKPVWTQQQPNMVSKVAHTFVASSCCCASQAANLRF